MFDVVYLNGIAFSGWLLSIFPNITASSIHNASWKSRPQGSITIPNSLRVAWRCNDFLPGPPYGGKTAWSEESHGIVGYTPSRSIVMFLSAAARLVESHERFGITEQLV